MKKWVFILIGLSLISVGCSDKKPAAKKPAAKKTEAAAPAAPAVIPEQDQLKVEKEIYVYDPKGRRDPFQSLIQQPAKAKAERKKGISPVENYDVEEVKLIAIAWDSLQYYAMITLPDRKSYTIRKGMTLGINSGKVTDITRDAIFIKEQVKDYKGQFRTRDTILKLRKEEEE
jgi:type IV pilus assembly protein PilP